MTNELSKAYTHGYLTWVLTLHSLAHLINVTGDGTFGYMIYKIYLIENRNVIGYQQCTCSAVIFKSYCSKIRFIILIQHG